MKIHLSYMALLVVCPIEDSFVYMPLLVVCPIENSFVLYNVLVILEGMT